MNRLREAALFPRARLLFASCPCVRTETTGRFHSFQLPHSTRAARYSGDRHRAIFMPNVAGRPSAFFFSCTRRGLEGCFLGYLWLHARRKKRFHEKLWPGESGFSFDSIVMATVTLYARYCCGFCGGARKE